jgi:hypothetical protein
VVDRRRRRPHHAGLDVTEADLILGTLAGSNAAAQITSASPTQPIADILAAAPQPHEWFWFGITPAQEARPRLPAWAGGSWAAATSKRRTSDSGGVLQGIVPPV